MQRLVFCFSSRACILPSSQNLSPCETNFLLFCLFWGSPPGCLSCKTSSQGGSSYRIDIINCIRAIKNVSGNLAVKMYCNCFVNSSKLSGCVCVVVCTKILPLWHTACQKQPPQCFGKHCLTQVYLYSLSIKQILQSVSADRQRRRVLWEKRSEALFWLHAAAS